MKTLYICIGPKCWGRGESTGEAIRNARKAEPTFNTGEFEYDLFNVGPEAWVDAQGNINDHTPPTRIREVRFHDGKRTVKEKFDAPVPRLL